MTHRRPFLAVLALACAALAVAAPVQAQAPAVAAAADLKFAMADLADAYQAATGRTVKLAFGSSGNFTQQIENGAPFELFLSADEGYVARLEAKGLTRDAGVLYAIGRLVLFVPAGSPLAHDGTLADLQRAIADGRLKRFAIANPEHAPYGRAAREALQAAGAWERIQPLLVLGENAVQATQFAAAGNAQGGLVPSSLAKAPEVARLGVATSVPDAMHRPLRQRMVLLKRATPAAEAFYAWLQSPPARAIFVRHGFALPGEG
ncbi:MAG TPA: molybdate ABC transporter substrate-binding protein [Casimicrobiaceae bacterium]|nr:molybdate ABC transporter substrate-binding protein [Casimicrobiaceae bacterium]